MGLVKKSLKWSLSMNLDDFFYCFMMLECTLNARDKAVYFCFSISFFSFQGAITAEARYVPEN